MKSIKELLNDLKNKKLETGIYTSVNDNGDNIIIEVTKNYIKTRTPQSNGWDKINYYYTDGTIEETYEK